MTVGMTLTGCHPGCVVIEHVAAVRQLADGEWTLDCEKCGTCLTTSHVTLAHGHLTRLDLVRLGVGHLAVHRE